jgi:uncharacterized membrane protein
MEHIAAYGLAFAIGIVAGLRTFTAPAAVAWSAHLGGADLRSTWASFASTRAALVILTALALFELYNDKRPGTPSRKSPPAFIARLVFGTLSGAALGAAARGSALAGGVCGALGAVAGTLGGYEARTRLVKALNAPDMAVALAEDAVAVAGGLFIASSIG